MDSVDSGFVNATGVISYSFLLIVYTDSYLSFVFNSAVLSFRVLFEYENIFI